MRSSPLAARAAARRHASTASVPGRAAAAASAESLSVDHCVSTTSAAVGAVARRIPSAEAPSSRHRGRSGARCWRRTFTISGRWSVHWRTPSANACSAAAACERSARLHVGDCEAEQRSRAVRKRASMSCSVGSGPSRGAKPSRRHGHAASGRYAKCSSSSWSAGHESILLLVSVGPGPAAVARTALTSSLGPLGAPQAQGVGGGGPGAGGAGSGACTAIPAAAWVSPVPSSPSSRSSSMAAAIRGSKPGTAANTGAAGPGAAAAEPSPGAGSPGGSSGWAAAAAAAAAPAAPDKPGDRASGASA
eukprot:9476172-Pyramimonas_sp.AAC.3